MVLPMLYRVVINMTKVMDEMTQLGIESHNNKTTTVYVDTKSPDDACAEGIRKVCKEILLERNTTRIKQLAKKILKTVSVKSARAKK